MIIAFVVGMNIGSTKIDLWIEHVLKETSKTNVFHSKASIETCFTPQQKCMSRVIHYIKMAQKSIYLRMFALTSKEVADALIRAHQRRIKIVVLCDRGQAKQASSHMKRLKEQGIVVHRETVRGYAHNKVIIIDRRMVLTGSYNYTAGAEHRNAENLLIIHDPSVVDLYLKDFQQALRTSR
jgi:phosphatidylserine/phosphatidylglycerophosphate/cardiolipin synthase-like enzyme